LPALLAKIDAAVREGRNAVEIWGSGRPRREFLHVDDLADAVIFLLKSWSDEEPINIGTGTDVTIGELAELIAGVVGFKGRFVYDVSKPDGTPRKLLDVAKLTALGWRPRISLETGIRQTYEWYRTARVAGIGGVRLGGPRVQPDSPHWPGSAQIGS
jgi:GDP-L-fucose synthase